MRLDKEKEDAHIKEVLDTLLRGLSVAILTDAGTPAIADPGARAVRFLIEKGLEVTPIPGPSAITTLVSVSGLNADRYSFAGFFPKKEGEAHEQLKRYSSYADPVVWFESPKRIIKTLNLINVVFPRCYCVVGKELTKKFEAIYRGHPKHILEELEQVLIKGEWCFVVSFPVQKSTLNTAFLDKAIQVGLSQQDIGALTKTLGWNKNEVYDYVLQHK